MAKLTKEEEEWLDIIKSEKFEKKFWLKFDRSVGKEKCWLWTGKPRKNEKEYVSIHIKGKKKMDAHRVSLTMKLKDFPKQDALHDEKTCRDNKYRCVNPNHLRNGSPSENRIDENTAEKTIRDKDGRKKLFNNILAKSSKSEKEIFYSILFNEL